VQNVFRRELHPVRSQRVPAHLGDEFGFIVGSRQEDG
jgi:hypothetical protein